MCLCFYTRHKAFVCRKNESPPQPRIYFVRWVVPEVTEVSWQSWLLSWLFFFVFFLPVKLQQKLQQRWLIKILAQGSSLLYPLWEKATYWQSQLPVANIAHVWMLAWCTDGVYKAQVYTFKDWSGHGHFSDKVYVSIQVLMCALGNIWGCGWGNPVWLAEAVATNHLLLRFPPAIMPKCSKFSNSQKFMIFGLSNILDPWPKWHKELTDGLSSKNQPKHRSNIFGTF